MLHPALSRALATAHIEDLHRAATPPTIRLQQRRLIRRLQQGRLLHLQHGGLRSRENRPSVHSR